MEVVAPNGWIDGTASLGTGATGFTTLPGLPAATAQLDFLAGRNINAAGVSMTGVNVAIEAAAPTYAAVGTILNFTDLSTGATPSNLVQFDDPSTVHIYAVAGDIVQPAFATSSGPTSAPAGISSRRCSICKTPTGTLTPLTCRRSRPAATLQAM